MLKFGLRIHKLGLLGLTFWSWFSTIQLRQLLQPTSG